MLAILTSTGLAMKKCGVENIDWAKGVEKAAEVMKEFEKIGFTMYDH